MSISSWIVYNKLFNRGKHFPQLGDFFFPLATPGQESWNVAECSLNCGCMQGDDPFYFFFFPFFFPFPFPLPFLPLPFPLDPTSSSSASAALALFFPIGVFAYQAWHIQKENDCPQSYKLKARHCTRVSIYRHWFPLCFFLWSHCLKFLSQLPSICLIISISQA